MTFPSQIPVVRITNKLTGTEAALEDLLLQHADLVSTIVRTGKELSVPAVTSQPILLRLARAQQSLLDARAELIRSHGQLLKIGQERGDILSGDCPSGSAPNHLSVAA